MNHEAREGHEGHEETANRSAMFDVVTKAVVDAGLKVHRALGPGLLETVYEHCLFHELTLRSISVRRQVVLPVYYEGICVDAGYRVDLIVNEEIIIEIKSVEILTRLHQSQLLTYLKLSGMKIGFLMNFNVSLFKDGLRRLVL